MGRFDELDAELAQYGIAPASGKFSGIDAEIAAYEQTPNPVLDPNYGGVSLTQPTGAQQVTGIASPADIEQAPGIATRALQAIPDAGVSLAKGVVGMGEAAVGVADIPTFGAAGKGMSMLGWDPKATKATMETWYSDPQQAANDRVAAAKGFMPTIQASLENPSTIVQSAVESLPSMLGGAAIARGILAKTAATFSPALAAGIGEGVVSAGSTAEGIRQETKSGMLTPVQSLISAGSGAGTALIGMLGGKLANRLGFDDIDVLLATGKPINTKAGVLKRLFESAISEGLIEELPQSAQEQMANNLALGKPIMDGVPEAAATGLLTGAAMGAVGAGGGALKAKQLEADKADELIGEVPQDAAQTALLNSMPAARGGLFPKAPTQEGTSAIPSEETQASAPAEVGAVPVTVDAGNTVDAGGTAAPEEQATTGTADIQPDPALDKLKTRQAKLQTSVFNPDGTVKPSATQKMQDNYAAVTAAILNMEEDNAAKQTMAEPAQGEVVAASPAGTTEPTAAADDGGTVESNVSGEPNDTLTAEATDGTKAPEAAEVQPVITTATGTEAVQPAQVPSVDGRSSEVVPVVQPESGIETTLKPKQQEFVRGKVEKLGSIAAVKAAYPDQEAPVDKYAVALAEQLYKEPTNGEVQAEGNQAEEVDQFEKAEQELDAIRPTIKKLEKAESNHIVMDVQTMNGKNPIKLAAPYNGTKEDALRVAKALKRYASEEHNASMRESAVFATDENSRPRYEFTQGEGVTEIADAPEVQTVTEPATSPDIIVKKDGTPFKTAHIARMVMGGHRKDTHEVVEHNGGFAIAPKVAAGVSLATEEKTDSAPNEEATERSLPPHRVDTATANRIKKLKEKSIRTSDEDKELARLQRKASLKVLTEAAPTDIKPSPLTMTDEQRAVEAESIAQTVSDFGGSLQTYFDLAHAKLKDNSKAPTGRTMKEIMAVQPFVVNTDEARPIYEGYRKDGITHAMSVHEAAKTVAGYSWREALKVKDPRGNNTVLFLGGGGSGKGSAMKNEKQPGLAEAYWNSQIIYDTTLSNYSKAKTLILDALEAGKQVRIAHIFRNLDQAVEGVVSRKHIENRDVPTDILAEDHFLAGQVFLDLFELFKDNKDVKFIAVDNTGDFDSKPISIDKLRALVDSKVEGHLPTAKHSIPPSFKKLVADLYQDAEKRHQSLQEGGEDNVIHATGAGALQQDPGQSTEANSGRDNEVRDGDEAAGPGVVQQHQQPQAGEVAFGANNKLVSVDRAAELKAKMKAKLNGTQLNSGFDPELGMMGAELAAFYVEGGLRQFSDFSRQMVADLGENVKPYLKMFYNAVRDYPGAEHLKGSMDDYAAVDSADIDALLKEADNDTARDSNDGTGALESSQPETLSEDDKGREPGAGERSSSTVDAGRDGDATGAGTDGDGSLAGSEDAVRDSGSEGDVPNLTATKTLQRTGENPGNFIISEDTEIGSGTRGERLDNNLAAIRLVKKLDAENRYPTREEQSILAKYVGWGGLKKAFDPTSKAPQDQKARKELAEILTPAEYDHAFNSTLDAHYTSFEVIRSIYKVLEHMGFQGGHVLEPTYGAGNFIGAMPSEMAAASKWYGSELDTITSKIGQYLYPNAQLKHSGFQDAEFPYGKFDLVIGNPPFGDQRIADTNKKRNAINRFKIHNYVIAKSGMHLKPGGVMAMVVTSRFMDTANDEARAHLAKEFKFLTAIRLPNDAFAKNAGTEVTTDLVFFQKLMPGESTGTQDMVWLETGVKTTNERGEDVTLNGYFAENPGNMIGIPSMKGTMYGSGDEFTLEKRAGQDVTAEIQNIIEGLDDLKGIMDGSADKLDAAAITITMNREDVGVGGYVKEGADIYMRGDDDQYGNATFSKLSGRTAWSYKHGGVSNIIAALKPTVTPETAKNIIQSVDDYFGKDALEGGTAETTKFGEMLKQLRQDANLVAIGNKPTIANRRKVQEALATALKRYELGDNNFDRIKAMLGLRETALKLIEAERFDMKGIEDLRAQLNKEYDAFQKEYGYINDSANATLMDNDIKIEAGLEIKYKKPITPARAKAAGTVPVASSAEKSALLKERVFFPTKEIISAESTKDAFNISLEQKGKIDIPYIAQLVSKSEKEVMMELAEAELIFQDPETLTWIQEDEYLAGNVKEKYKQVVGREGYEKNAKRLKEVFPEDVKTENIFADLGATWIDAETYQDFLAFMGVTKAKVSVSTLTGKVTAVANQGIVKNDMNILLENNDYSVPELFNLLANKQAVVAYDKDEDGKRIVNKDRTKLLAPIAKRFKATFKDWIFADSLRANKLTISYNDTQNTHAERQYNGARLQTHGASPLVELRTTQRNAAWRMIQSPVTLLDHTVGAGKTMTVITGLMERRRLGLSKKPVVVVPNHLVGQWARDFVRLYPGANVMAATEKDFSTKNRRRLFARMATGKYDAIIIGHSSLGFIPLEKETEAEFVREEVEYLKRALSQAEEDGDKRTVRTVANRIVKKEQRVKELLNKERDDVVSFENMGIDYLAVDESHEFKNLEYSTSMQNVAGMGTPTGAKKSFDLYSKVQYTLGREGGVTFATGTPISNSLVEMYTILRYLNRKGLKARNLDAFDAWVKAYASVEARIEFTSTQKLKERQIMASFNNLPELLQLYKEFADIITMPDFKRMYAEQAEQNNKRDNTDKPLSPVPKVKDGGRQLNIEDATPEQKEYMEYLVARASALEEAGKDMNPKIDNHLWVMNDARKMALDIRLVDPTAPDHPNNKVNRAARRIKEIFDATTKDKGTQIVFCDLSTPAKTAGKDAKAFINKVLDKLGLKNNKDMKARLDSMTFQERWDYLRGKIEIQIEALAEEETKAASAQRESLETFLENVGDDETAALLTADTGFSVYDELKAKLIASGIPANEVRFIHEANSSEQKQELFQMVKSGTVRVLIGSSKKMGTGMNVQERAVALHHMDAPWRPSDVEQREGRVIRQNNKLYLADPDGFMVEINAYSSRNTFDAVMWQVLARKAEMLEQFRSGVRSFTEVNSDSASYAEFMAESTGNPAFKEKFELEKEIEELEGTERNITARRLSAEHVVSRKDVALKEAETQVTTRERDLKEIEGTTSFTYEGKEYKEDMRQVEHDLMEEYRTAFKLYDGEELPAYESALEEETNKIAAKIGKKKFTEEDGNKQLAEWKKANKQPKAPRKPTLRDIAKKSEAGQLVLAVAKALETEGRESGEIELAYGGAQIVITREPYGKDEFRYSFSVNGWNDYNFTTTIKGVPERQLEILLSDGRIRSTVAQLLDRAKMNLKGTQKGIADSELTLDKVKFEDGQKLTDKKARLEVVVAEVNRLEAEMEAKREDEFNKYIDGDRERFADGKFTSKKSGRAPGWGLTQQRDGVLNLRTNLLSELAERGQRGRVSKGRINEFGKPEFEVTLTATPAEVDAFISDMQSKGYYPDLGETENGDTDIRLTFDGRTGEDNTFTLDMLGLQQVYEALANSKTAQAGKAKLQELGAHFYAQGKTAWKEWFAAMKEQLGKLFAKYRPMMEGVFAKLKEERGSFSIAPVTDAQKNVLAKIGAPKKTLSDKWAATTDRGALKTEQGMFDKFAALKMVDMMAGVTDISKRAYVAARMATSMGDMILSMMKFGHPIWRDGGYDRAGKGLSDIFKPVSEDREAFLGWLVGERAQKLMNEGRERYFTQEEINELKALKTPENAARWEKARREYVAFKKGVLDFAQQAGVINAEARAIWDHEEYVPFYRVQEDKPSGPHGKKGIASQSSGIRTLKGGESPLGDIFENILQNFTHLVDASIKNHATELAITNAEQVGIAVKAPNKWKAVAIDAKQIMKNIHEIVGETEEEIDLFFSEQDREGFLTLFHPARPEGQKIIHVLRNGKPEYYEITDELVLNSLTSINQQVWGGPAMQSMRFVKRLLTLGVTITPDFILRNVTRDTLHSWTISRGKFLPVLSSAVGAMQALRNSEDYQHLIAAGGAFVGGHMNSNDPSATARQLKRMMKQRNISWGSVMDTPAKLARFITKLNEFDGAVEKAKYLAATTGQNISDLANMVWEPYQALGAAMENAARIQTYTNDIKDGKSHLEAAFNAKDLMDFSMRGDYKTIRFLTETVPFLGARMQGLHRLHKGYRENPKAFLLKGSAIALASMALWMINADDERYRELEEWDKDMYYHFFIGEYHVRLPKPFEVGAIFGTVPERMLEAFFQEHDSKLLRERMLTTLTQTFAFGWPQMLSEPIQQIANKDFFTKRPIVGDAQQGLLPEDQATYRTSPTAVAAGEATGMSPARIEHAVKGIFGSIGMYALGATDVLTRRLMDYPVQPTSRIEDLPALKAFYRGKGPARNTKYTTEFYKLMEEVDQIAGSIRDREKSGEIDKASKLADDNQNKLMMRDMGQSARKQLSNINKRIKAIHLDRQMTADEKLAEIDGLHVQKNNITKLVMDQVKAKK